MEERGEMVNRWKDGTAEQEEVVGGGDDGIEDVREHWANKEQVTQQKGMGRGGEDGIEDFREHWAKEQTDGEEEQEGKVAKMLKSFEASLKTIKSVVNDLKKKKSVTNGGDEGSNNDGGGGGGNIAEIVSYGTLAGMFVLGEYFSFSSIFS